MISGQIKLVVWDLDDTFWAGTLSEEGCRVKTENVAILRALVDRGIMNSICSKNDFDKAKARLQEIGVWDLFVFPRINWQSKGPQIAELIDSCRLRPVNVLFVDDNPTNLREAEFFSPGLQTAAPEILPRLLEMPAAGGRQDLSHARLAQFKLLERKQEARKSFSTNEEFLRASNIQVALDGDCLSRADRILELIERTNQLNFTKKRIGRDELIALLHDQSARNLVVSVKDAYGDYGIAGFVSIRNGACEHFLFSCRVLGLGVEQWVYATLGCPQITVAGETACTLSPTARPDWINRENPGGQAVGKMPHVGLRVLMRGGCDLRQMEQYLDFERLDVEFNSLKFHRDHTAYAVDAISPSPLLDDIRRNVPFVQDDFFDTGIFSGGYDVVVFSVLIDYVQAVFRSRKHPEVRIAYGDFRRPLSRSFTGGYSDEELEWFFDNFECTGVIGEDELADDLERIRNRMPAHVRLVVVNGCEVEHENPDEPGGVEVHRRLNRAIDRFVSRHYDVQLLDMRKVVTRRDQLTNNMRHYTREVYFRMAQELRALVGGSDVVKPRRRSLLRRVHSAAVFCLDMLKRHSRVSLKALALYVVVNAWRRLMRRRIWMFSDRMSRADDNGRVMFDYVRSLPLGKNAPRCIFAIDAKSPDYEEIRSSGGEVVDATSWRYKFMFLLSDFIISAYHTPAMRMPFHGDFIACARTLVDRPKFVYLRHGIGIHGIAHICNRRNDNATIMITTVEGEYRSVVDGGTGYTEKEVKLTGLPRYDLLYDDRKKIVTFMPTWRPELIEWSGDGHHRLAAGAERSRFVAEWRRILSDDRLISACERLGYTLQLMPHPNLAPVVPVLSHDAKVRILPSSMPYRKVFAETDLLITDYSSAVFDFAYLRKPLLYFQYDRREFFSGLYKPGFFDYDRDGLGKVETTAEGLIDEIIRSLEAGCPLPPEYGRRMDAFFAYNDRQNRRRVYEAILDASMRS